MARATGFALCLVAMLLLGCGDGSSSDKTTSRSPAEEKQRRTCLEARENGIGLYVAGEKRCAKVGVTDSSPPRSSPEAKSAAKATESEAIRLENAQDEKPAKQIERRLAALTDMSKGNLGLAEAELISGCPNATERELVEAWFELKELAKSHSSGVSLEDALRAICPL